MPRPAPKLPLPSRLGRLLGRGRQAGAAELPGHPPEEDPLLQVGRLLQREREARGLNLRQMALETRISTPVLEALERGWRDRLPEGTYLRTMLPLLEQHLELPAGSLNVALPPQFQNAERQRGRQGLLQRFTPGSIDVFSTWQGTLIYAALALGLIYGLNLQQQQLAAANLLTLRPVPPLPPTQQNTPPDPGAALTSAYPDLRPLNQASRGMALGALQRSTTPAAANSPGVLQLNLSQPSSLALSSQSGERSQLQGVSGELVLQLHPPLQLTISPAPKAGEVLWDGQPLAPLPQRAGQYQLPQPKAAAQRP
jgi:hypothetical protein